MQVVVNEEARQAEFQPPKTIPRGSLEIAYKTKKGTMYHGFAEQMARSEFMKKHRGKVRLILTSPPFPLNRKKRYGNLQGQEYIDWLSDFASLFKELLDSRGSIVIEVGNAWEKGLPVMSPLALEALLEFRKKGGFYLCQQFVCYNYARLPGPAEWVNVRRIRVKDAYTHAWWMSPSAFPYAYNKHVLTPYRPDMVRLLETGKYNWGERRSEHVIGERSFLRDNGGAIPSNVLEFANTRSSDDYLEYCRRHRIKGHPARMPMSVADFFVKFLTTKDKLVLDPFAGSNVSGAAAEKLGRHWISVEPLKRYISSSRGRFPNQFS